MKNERSDIVVIGASAGGVSALQTVVAALPDGLEASVFVVLHLWPGAESLLPQILSRAGKLPAVHPADRALLETGRMYVAPPDRHILFNDGYVRVVRGPKENLHRPSIDVLFRSAAVTYGPRVVGVLLTGSDDDGAAGLKIIGERGGITVVQDPADSPHPEMPQNAMRVLEPDFVLPAAGIGPLLDKIVRGQVKPARKVSMPNPKEPSSREDQGLPIDVNRLGAPTAFSCPDCSGTLWELQEGELIRYRCRVGHAYSPTSMVQAQSDAVERALWEAVRVLEESAQISRRIAAKTESLRRELTRKAEERDRSAKIIRDLLSGNHV